LNRNFLNVQNVQREWKAWVKAQKWERPVGVTLTLKKGISSQQSVAYGNPDIYSEELHHFLNVVDRKVFGKGGIRKGLTLCCFPVIEQDQSGRYHFHLLLDRPKETDAKEFECLIRSYWPRLRWGYEQIDVQTNADMGWVDYILKRRSKKIFEDGIDVGNIRFRGRVSET